MQMTKKPAAKATMVPTEYDFFFFIILLPYYNGFLQTQGLDGLSAVFSAKAPLRLYPDPFRGDLIRGKGKALVTDGDAVGLVYGFVDPRVRVNK